MLRTLEHGYDIQVVAAQRPTIGVDTPEELCAAENALRFDPMTETYLGKKVEWPKNGGFHKYNLRVSEQLMVTGAAIILSYQIDYRSLEPCIEHLKGWL